jgi:hypothetical protein
LAGGSGNAAGASPGEFAASGIDAGSSAGHGTGYQQTQSASARQSSVRSRVGTFEIWLPLLGLMLILLPVALWAIIKAVRKHETSQDGEVVYQNLQDARQIYGKIIK